MQQNASVITGASGMSKKFDRYQGSEKVKTRHVSPECMSHLHYACPVRRLAIKCECLCHKLVGE